MVFTKVATNFSIHRYACEGCGCEVEVPFAGGFIGPVAKSFTTLLHYYSGAPFGKILEMLGWVGFRVSEGALALRGWTFLSEEVSHHNNSAESALGRVVLNYKVSNGHVGDLGDRAQEVLPGTIQTACMQGKNLPKTMLNPQTLSWNTS